jgi:hypothetical protein
MAVGLPNIDPSKWGDFTDVFNDISKNKLQKAEAEKASMIARLLNQVMGGGGNSGSSGGGNLGISQKELARGILGLPAETPQEGEERQTRLAKNKGKNEADLKTSGEIEEDASKLYELKDLVTRAKAILKRRPDLTGRTAGFLGKMGVSTDPDIAALDEIFGNIQATKARIAGERGGVGLINWAANVKPSISKQGAYNMSMLDSMDTGLDRKYRELTHRYGIKTGNSLDDVLGQKLESNNQLPEQTMEESNSQQSLPQVNQQPDQQAASPLVPTSANAKGRLKTIITPDNAEHQVYEQHVPAALAKYPGSRLKEEAS